MKIVSVFILALIQGIAEFLPISSSAHLIIFRDLFGIGKSMGENMELTFDIALHLGTLLAIGIYFFKDFINMIVKGFQKGVKDKEGKILWYLIAATIPAAIVGVLFEDPIENIIRKKYYIIALALLVMGIIIYLADKYSKSTKDIEKLSLKDALIIGCSQVFALIPGFSRSGTTIAAGRLLSLKREDAAKFSFFLSAPVVCGAVVLKLLDKETWTLIFAEPLIFILGIFLSFVVGLICIKWLLKYLDNHNFKIFMIYRVVLALAIIGYLIIGG